jgi:hypothetical protein
VLASWPSRKYLSIRSIAVSWASSGEVLHSRIVLP